MKALGLILAAGNSSRFGNSKNKLRENFRGKPLISYVLEAAKNADFEDVAVVVGKDQMLDLIPQDFTILENSSSELGLASSLRVGVDYAFRFGYESVIVALGDMPFISSLAFEKIRVAEDASIAVCTYNGVRGHPVKLGKDVWFLLPISGDVGAKSLFDYDGRNIVEIECDGNCIDIDTEEDLKEWNLKTK